MIKNIFKKTIILLDILLIGFILFMCIKEGLPSDDIQGFFVVLILIGLPTLNIIAILTTKNEGGWLSLFLKRKTLEEKRKIEQIENKK